MNQNRTDIAYQIAKELLEQDALDVNNFGYDTDSLLFCTGNYSESSERLSDCSRCIDLSIYTMYGIIKILAAIPYQNTQSLLQPVLQNISYNAPLTVCYSLHSKQRCETTIETQGVTAARWFGTYALSICIGQQMEQVKIIKKIGGNSV